MSAIALRWLNARIPPGRRSRAASGTTLYGSANVKAPWSQKTTSKVSSGSGTVSAEAWTSGKSTPASDISFRACSSCRSELSSPTGRAPAFASRIDHCAAPHPSSSTSFRATSPRTCSSDSRICQTPQRGSPCPMNARCLRWYSSLLLSQYARFRSASSDTLACLPDLLGGPAARPVRWNEVVERVVARRLGRSKLPKTEDLEPGPTQQAEHVPVAQVVLDALVVPGPLHPPELELRTQQPFLDPSLVGHAHHRERRVAKEDELAARAEQAVSLANPLLGIDPDRRAVLGQGEIERRIGKGNLGGVRFDKWERDAGLSLHPPCGLELRRGDVDADRARSAPREPG